ncbi:MAG: DsbC family protein [Xanthomonadaceae bacterium]|nr:DsbC family protein [Xanthomonadaceae bacterium]
MRAVANTGIPIMLKNLVLFAALVTAVPFAHAADPAEKTVRDAVHSLLPLAVIDHVNKSDLPGFYEVIISGQFAYVSADGKYLLQGSLYDVPHKKNLTEASLENLRAEAIAKLPASKEIRFDAANPKHTVTVFTDVDCPYCRAFHKNIGQYNALGISVHYVMFPLDIHPGADKKAEAVWCAKDRNAAYTAAMNGHDPGTATCVNPVAETKSLGIELGISATPTVLTDDGTSVDLAKATSPQGLLAELDRLAAERAKAKVAAR